MSGLIDDLIDNINSQAKKYNNLLSILENKNKAIVNSDIEGLNKITFEEQVAAGAIQKLEKARLSIIKDMAIVLGKTVDELTLNELVKILKKQPDEAQRLEAASIDIKNILEDVKRLNEQNSMLLKNAIDYVDFSINVLRSSQSVELPSYPDKQSNIGRQSIFDTKQ